MTLHIEAGLQAGDLTVVGFSGSEKGHRMYRCLCTCGTEVVVRGERLRTGKATSCGCKTKEKLHKRFLTHGKTDSREYRAYHAMKQRCLNPKFSDYENYGGRGIKICPEWLESFEQFLKDMGSAPEGFELDRKDPDGDYSPQNCRWLSHKEQQRNKRNTIWVEYEGERVPLVSLAEKFGLPRSRVHQRFKRGLPLSECLK